MKICFFADSQSIHTKRWCTHFSELGYDVHLISFKQDCQIPGIHFYPVYSRNINVKGGNWRVLLKVGKVKKILKSIKPDIFHALYATSYGVVGALANYHPFIITSLGTDVLISPQNSKIYKYLLKFAFNRADWLTTMAEHMKIAANKIGDFGHKTDVVPFGIDTDLFNSKNRRLSNEAFVVTSTRNFEKVYNIPDILKAVSIAKEKIPNIQLNIIGSGSMESELKAIIEELNLNHLVHFYGRVKQTKMVDVLQQSHVFVSVSSSDGNNISLNEAMACGCFPIATNIDANIQWLKHGENGFLVDVNNIKALAELLVESYVNFEELSSKALLLNQKIIEEKADWFKNVKSVEQKYLSLIK